MNKVQTLEEITSLIIDNKEQIQIYGVERLGIFGSFLFGKQQNKSDVDILVQFSNNQKTFKNFISLAYYLEDLLGRKVELVTVESLSPYLKPHILKRIEYVKVA